MLDSGKFSDQIKRGFSKDKPSEVQAKEQGTMWSRFVGAIVRARSMPPEWSYAQTIWENRTTVLAQVGAMLPSGQQLDEKHFNKVMEDMGVG